MLRLLLQKGIQVRQKIDSTIEHRIRAFLVSADPNQVLRAAVRREQQTQRSALRPVLDAADYVLDLHSMLWPSEPLILCGPTAKGRALAVSVGTPPLVVADHGHVAGRRLIDYGRFVEPDETPTAILVEAGQHWEASTVQTMQDAVHGLLAATGLGPPRPAQIRSRCAEVTQVVTAASGAFTFTQAFQGGDVVRRRHTLIAIDGGIEVRTPHDDCLLVMPSLRPSRGHTAVRLARFVDCHVAL